MRNWISDLQICTKNKPNSLKKITSCQYNNFRHKMFPKRDLQVLMNVFYLLLTAISEVLMRHEQKQN